MIGIIKPFQQLHTGAFSTAAAPHKGQRLAGLHGHIQSIQDLDIWSGGVGELAVNELNVSLEVILKTNKNMADWGGKGVKTYSTKVLFGFTECYCCHQLSRLNLY